MGHRATTRAARRGAEVCFRSSAASPGSGGGGRLRILASYSLQARLLVAGSGPYNMASKSDFWQAGIGLATLLATIVAPFLSYGFDVLLLRRGSVAPKQLEVNEPIFTDVLTGIRMRKDQTVVSVDGEEFKTLFVGGVRLTNKGEAPILPAEIHEPITVEVDNSLRIVAIQDTFDKTPGFRWIRVNDHRFQLVPALINPADVVSANVYLTGVDAAKSPEAKTRLDWGGRIEGLARIGKEKAPSLDDLVDTVVLPVTVHLASWKLVFVVFLAPILHVFYLRYMRRVGWIAKWTNGAIARIALAGLLAFSVAEAVGSIVVPTASDRLLSRYGASSFPNWLVIWLHIAFSCALLRMDAMRARDMAHATKTVIPMGGEGPTIGDRGA